MKPIERIKMIMTRNQDDPKELYKLIGHKRIPKGTGPTVQKRKIKFQDCHCG